MIVNKHVITALLILAMVGLGCSYLSKKGGDFTSVQDKFSISFPAGPDGVKTDTSSAKFAKSGNTYSKSFDNRSDNFRSYEVQAMEIDPSRTSGKDARAILEIGLNGWEDEPGTVVKEVTVNGQKGIDSVRTMEVGPAKMTFREAVFWSEKDKKLYVVQIAATKKENVAAKEADDFVNSFKLSAG